MEGLGKVVTEVNRLSVTCEGKRGESRLVNRGDACLSPGYREVLKMLAIFSLLLCALFKVPPNLRP